MLREWQALQAGLPKVNAQFIRETQERQDCSRALFACRLYINERTLENWEQGRAKPNAQAAVLLLVVRHFPDTLERLRRIVSPDPERRYESASSHWKSKKTQCSRNCKSPISISWHQIEIHRAQFRSPGIRSKSIPPDFDLLASDRNPSRPISISCARAEVYRVCLLPGAVLRTGPGPHRI